MTHAEGPASRLCPPSSSQGCSRPMAGATSAPWGGAPRCCAAPQGPTHPAGLLREQVWLLCPCLRIPCALLHLHPRRLLLRAPSQPWARWQPALPAPRSPSLHPARALSPAEKLPNLPFQSSALSTHARKANTDGKPRRSPTPLPPARRRSCGRGRELCLGGKGRFSCNRELILTWRIVRAGSWWYRQTCACFLGQALPPVYSRAERSEVKGSIAHGLVYLP